MLLLTLVVVGCRNGSHPEIVAIAESLVPEGSKVTEVAENTGLTIEAGDYFAGVQINDGGRGPALLGAIEDLASAGGWEERYRCEVPAGITLGYSRDAFTVDVSVRINQDPVNAHIRIQRLGDGNPWPPDC